MLLISTHQNSEENYLNLAQSDHSPERRILADTTLVQFKGSDSPRSIPRGDLNGDGVWLMRETD